MIELHKEKIRAALPARREPYWTRVQRGQYLGFRKIDGSTGTWIARHRDDDGKQNYKSLGFDSDAFGFDQAKQSAEIWFKLQEAGINTDEVVTVADACRRYVQHLIQCKRPAAAHDASKRFERTVYGRPETTTETYRPQKGIPSNPLGKRPMEKLRKAHIVEWRESLGLNAANTNRIVTALKAALNLAVTERNCPVAQLQEWGEVVALDYEAKPRPFLDLEQRRAWIGAATGALRDLIEGACLTGARPGELVSARVSQWDRRTQSMTWKGKTGTRVVPVADGAAQLLDRLSKSKLPAAYLFTRDDGKPWNHSDWDQLVKEAAKAAGFADDLAADVVLYCARHAWITEALTSGLSTLDVSKLTGTSINMIEQTYGHLVVNSARERLRKVAMI